MSIFNDDRDSLFNLFYIKLLMFALLPILLFGLCYSLWTAVALYKKDFTLIKNRAISSLVILLFFVHPNIMQFMFGVFK